MKNIDCPICGKYSFNLSSNDDSNDYCIYCGWKFDKNQLNNGYLKEGKNKLSINEYKDFYNKKLEKNPSYEYCKENHIKTSHICPICGKYKFNDYGLFDICPNDGWEDDPLQNENPNYSGGANNLSLNDYKKDYQDKLRKNPNYKWINEK